MRVMDGDQYQELFSKIFLQKAPCWWDKDKYRVPSPSRKGARLVITGRQCSFTNSLLSAKPSYGKAIKEAQKMLLRRGIIDNNHLTTFAEWYISCYKVQLRSAFNARFNFLFLDEAQDTSKAQYCLLQTITRNTDISFQRFGDPYQALYTIYGNEREDAWRPIEEEERRIAQILEISATSRFGSNIADLVKQVCFEDYPNFHSNIKCSYFPKFFLTYKTKSELMTKYTKIIQNCSSHSEEFSSCTRKDTIVSPQHADLEGIFLDQYVRPTSVSANHEKSFKSIYLICIKVLAAINHQTMVEQAKAIQQSNMQSVAMSIIIKELYCAEKKNEGLVPQLKLLLTIKETADEQAILLARKLTNCIRQFDNHILASEEDGIGRKIELSTIHHVKGETHRSTLLLINSQVDTSVYDFGSNPFWKVLFPFLIGERIDYGKEKHSKLYKDCLKFAYVALSRPKFLVGIAIPAKNIDTKKRDCLLKSGWKEVM